ncbi:hypothetical protein ADEAN_000209500 [Angomonas deanei]|uniref:Uncharacterized protein n=1 Tax=Angomonas deanei TaxID=59799 RepID=A0A7G2C6A6_9TRYP|nr:hypothetical protein ADEAN_000209500 [Angomonas deanei]
MYKSPVDLEKKKSAENASTAKDQTNLGTTVQRASISSDGATLSSSQQSSMRKNTPTPPSLPRPPDQFRGRVLYTAGVASPEDNICAPLFRELTEHLVKDRPENVREYLVEYLKKKRLSM